MIIRQSLKYGVGLIALYLVVANASKSGQVISAGAQGITNVSKTLQGR